MIDSSTYITEAIEIGEYLIKNAFHDTHGLWWDTFQTYQQNKDLSKITLFDGTSGIIIFLLALFSVTRERKYLVTAEKAISFTLYSYRKRELDNSLGSGKAGIIFMLSKAYEYTGKEEYPSYAKEIIQSINLKNEKKYDYLSGIAGTMLALTYFHAITKDHQTFLLIKRYLKILINSIYIAPKGIYWEFSPYKARPLNGFSHGVSGIGFVLIQLGQYFNNKALLELGGKALAFENEDYNPNINNWPTYPSFDTLTEYTNLYRKQELQLVAYDLVQWCHGAPGIGISHLKAFEIIHKKHLYNDVLHSIKKVKEEYLDDMFLISNRPLHLCCGAAGAANLFIEAYRYTDTRKYITYTKQIAERIIHEKNNRYFKIQISTRKYNLGLFQGLSGIGYFFLQTAYPLQIPSIIVPTIKKISKESTESLRQYLLPITREKIQYLFIKKRFPQTLEILKNCVPLKTLYKIASLGNKKQEEKLVYEINHLPEKIRIEILNTFTLEKSIEKLQWETFTKKDQSSKGLYLTIKNKVDTEKNNVLLHLPLEQFINIPFQLNTTIKIVKNNCTQTGFVLKKDSTTVKITPITVQERKLLNLFKKKRKVKNCLYKTKTRLINQKKLLSIRKFIRLGWIVHAEWSL